MKISAKSLRIRLERRIFAVALITTTVREQHPRSHHMLHKHANSSGGKFVFELQYEICSSSRIELQNCSKCNERIRQSLLFGSKPTVKSAVRSEADMKIIK